MLLIAIAANVLGQQYEARFSQFEVSERYGALANYIIARYEQGVDISRREFRQGRFDFDSGDARNDLLVIRDMQSERVIFGDRSGSERDTNVDFSIVSESGARYMANVGIPPRPNPLPDLTTPAAIATAMGTSLLYSWLFTFVLTRPISRLKEHVQSLGRGALDQKLESRLMNRRDEIGDLASSIDEMSSYIQELLNSKQRLLFDVSHELRAPLARMQVAAGIARAEAESAGVDTSMHDRFEQEIEALNALISELLLLAKTENSGDDCQNFSLAGELNSLVEDMQFGFPDRQIKTQFRQDGVEVKLSITLFDRVVKNLIENALKYSSDEVLVCLDEDEGNWIVQVKDQGEGIPEEQIESMMQPFTRLQAESVEGFGLGLSIAMRAAKALGGSLKLANRPDGGLVASLTLPKVAVDKES